MDILTSVSLVTRLTRGAFVALVLILWFGRMWNYERQAVQTSPTLRTDGRKDTVVWLTPWVLPAMIPLLWLVLAAIFGPAYSSAVLLELSLQLVVLLTFYFGLLLALLPLLRRWISARACATLWLLPVFVCFYLNTWTWSKTFLPPLAVLRVPPGLAPLLLGVWLAGALAVVLWHTVSHLRFRKALLAHARPVEDQQVLALWHAELRLISRTKPIPLLVSPRLSSPLTIGLWDRALRTVLPQRDYTQEQYRLIFRHELRHVQRRDVDTKCFYIFCKALCWFNPLVWIALNKAAADLELSCDEMVVYGAAEDTRREYAALLLDCAGDDRGLSTCLSASASSLRRRLRGVLKPGARFSGALVLGIAVLALTLCTGLVTVSGSYGSLGELVLEPQGQVRLDSATVRIGLGRIDRGSLNTQTRAALLDYLSDLPVTRLTTGRELYGATASLTLGFNHKALRLEVQDQLCILYIQGTNDLTATIWQIDQPVDWAYVLEVLTEDL